MSGGTYEGNYKRPIQAKIVDFRLWPWSARSYRDITFKDQIVGHYKIFINEINGDFGHEIFIFGSQRTIICWEEKKMLNGTSVKLDYVAFVEGGEWVRRRTQSIFPHKTEIDVGKNAVSLFFRLLINNNEEFFIPFLIK